MRPLLLGFLFGVLSSATLHSFVSLASLLEFVSPASLLDFVPPASLLGFVSPTSLLVFLSPAPLIGFLSPAPRARFADAAGGGCTRLLSDCKMSLGFALGSCRLRRTSSIGSRLNTRPGFRPAPGGPSVITVAPSGYNVLYNSTSR